MNNPVHCPARMGCEDQGKINNMNWEAIGAIGELVGAFAVVFTLGFLAVQLRQNNRTMTESNRLERVAAIDRHADSVSRWRGRLMENPHLAVIWMKAYEDEELNEHDQFMLDNLFIDFINTQRANFVRSNVVGEEGLRLQAIRSVAVEIAQCDTFRKMWEISRHWFELASAEFTVMVEQQIDVVKDDKLMIFRPHIMAKERAETG